MKSCSPIFMSNYIIIVDIITSASSSCPNKHHQGQTRSNTTPGNDCSLFPELSGLHRLQRIFAVARSSLMSLASTELLTSYFSYLGQYTGRQADWDVCTRPNERSDQQCRASKSPHEEELAKESDGLSRRADRRTSSQMIAQGQVTAQGSTKVQQI